MVLKDILQILFVDRTLYNTITAEDKQKNGWIINRTMAMYYPEQSKSFSFLPDDLQLDVWYSVIKQSSTIPFWFWSSLKTKLEKTDDIIELEKQMDIEITRFCKLYLNKELDILIKKMKSKQQDIAVFSKTANKNNNI